MIIIPVGKEDKIKSIIYKEISKKFESDFSEYLMESVTMYDIYRYGKLEKIIKNSVTLEEILIEIAEKARENRKTIKKFVRKGKKNFYDYYDRKAFVFIKRCCKDKKFVFEYYRFYRNLKKGRLNIYINNKEESIPIAEDY